MSEHETHEVIVSICGPVPDWCRCEIVRCRDCKYSYAIKARYQKEIVNACLNFDNADVEPDGFCAWGERKEDGE